MASTEKDSLAKKRLRKEDENHSLKRPRNRHLEKPEPIISDVEAENYATSSAPKKTLHGLTYQLRLLTLFLQRVPDDQEFFLATEMKEAEQFDDIFLKYKKNGVWRCKFLQVKHKNDTTHKIRKIDLFSKRLNSKINTKSDKPYFLKTYYDSFCKIKENDFFNDALLEEFLVCTNIGFDKDALSYFKSTKEIEDDPILGNWVLNEQASNQNTKPNKYKLRKRNYSELKQRLNVNRQNEEKLSQFIELFRYLVNYEDNELNENIRFGLRQFLRFENTDLAYAYLQNRVLKWFESYQNNQSKYLLIKDKKKFLEELNNTTQSLLVAGYSFFYIDDLRKYKMEFDNTLSVHDFLRKDKGIYIIVTQSTKLSAIKVSQLFAKLEFNQDEIIFVDADKIQQNFNIINVFVSEPSYQWLVIEFQNRLNIDTNRLVTILKRIKEKYVIIIVEENNVLDFKYLDLNTLCFYDQNNSFKDLTSNSQFQLLERQVTFQGNKVNLNQLIDIHLAREIIDASTLERLLLDNMVIGNNDALISHSLVEDYYTPRILASREIQPNIFQNKELLKQCLFFITNATEDHLKKINIKNEWVFSWDPNVTFKNGIVLANQMEPKNILCEICKNNTENVCWIEFVDGRFFLQSIRNGNDILSKHDICFEEDDLSNQKLLKEKVVIVAGGPGCGKSIFMTVVARQLKKISSDIWILRINLSSYVYNRKKYKNQGDQNDINSLEDITFRENDTNKAIVFLANLLYSEKDKSQNQYFVRELLIKSLSCDKKYCKRPKIILLFDGFDEISPKFKEKTLLLLTAIKSSNIEQMWVTTRNHEELSLEKALGASAFFLNPIENVNKITFLNNFWLFSLYNLDDKNSDKYSVKIFSYITEIRQNIKFSPDCEKVFSDINNYSLNDIMNKLNFSDLAQIYINYLEFHKLSDFTDNILHLNMLAETLFQNKFTELGNKSLPFFYKEFINTKFAICCEDKNAAGNSVLGREIFEGYLKNLQTSHQELAFQILFPEYEQYIKETDNKAIMVKTGILVIYGEQLDFVHRSFAEYFVSEYFANNLQYEYIQDFIFSDILVNKNYELIRSFLNNNQNFLNKLSNKTQGMINIISKKCFKLELLYQIVREKTFDILISYIKDLPSDFFEKAVHTNDECANGKDILVYVCSYITKDDEFFFKSVLNVIKCSVSSKTFNELLFSVDRNFEQTILHFALLHRNSVAKTILEFVGENCDSSTFWKLFVQENNMKMTVLHIACIKCPRKIDENDYEEILVYLLNLAKNNEVILNEFILKADCFENTALYYANHNFESFSIFKVLLDFTKKYCTHETLKILLLKINKENQTILHNICIEKNQEYLSDFLTSIKDKPDILNELLLKRDIEGNTVLHYTIINYDTPSMLETLLKFIIANCSTEILNTLLITANNFECSVLYTACTNVENKMGHKEILISLLDLVKCNKQILNELILKTDMTGTTILHLILTEFETPYMLEVILEFLKRDCDLEIFNTLLLKVNNKGHSILHLACALKHTNMLIYFLSTIQPEIISNILIKPDNDGLNPLHCCILLYDNPVRIKLLLDFIKMNCSLNILNSLLFSVNSKGHTLLHLACILNKASKTKYVEILTFLLNEIDDTKLNDILFKKDCEKKTILHYILSSFDSPSMLKALLDFVKIKCNKEIFEKFLSLTDSKEQTGLHMLCKTDNNEEILTYLLNIVEENTNRIFFNEFLFKKDLYGKAALDYVTCKSSSPMLNVLTNFIQLHSI